MKRLCYRLLATGAFLLLGTSLNAQINLTGGQTAQQLAEYLAGPNITVTNAVLSEGNTALPAGGTSNAAGQFTGTNSDIGFDSGVILSSGNSVNEAAGPNSSNSTGANLGNSGTAQMTALAGANTFDAITLNLISKCNHHSFSSIMSSPQKNTLNLHHQITLDLMMFLPFSSVVLELLVKKI